MPAFHDEGGGALGRGDAIRTISLSPFAVSLFAETLQEMVSFHHQTYPWTSK